MNAIRAFFHRHRALAVAVIALALAMKVLVPAGFMPLAEGRTISVIICDGHGDQRTATIALPGKASGGDTADLAKAATNCPFSVLSAATLGNTDVLLVAALLLFILSLGYLSAPARPQHRAAYLTPPSCGPPALA